MRNAWVIAQREIASYFAAPMFWILAGGFMAFSGFLFWLYINQPTPPQADMLPLLQVYGTILLFITPLLAIGVLTSSMTESQVVAGFLGIMVIMVLFFLSIVKQMPFGESGLGAAVAYLGLSDHYYKFGQGVVDTRDIVYFLSLTFGSLFLATRMLETRRWR